MSSDKFALPTPVRYDEVSVQDTNGNFKSNPSSYIVAGAKLACTKSKECLAVLASKSRVDQQSRDYYIDLSNEGHIPRAQVESDIAAAKKTTTKYAASKSPVTLSTLFRGATTGFSIAALDCDTKPENFVGEFKECLGAESCSHVKMQALWDLGFDRNDSGKLNGYGDAMGMATTISYDYVADNPESLTCTSKETKTVTNTNYPLTMDATLPCIRGVGVVSILLNGQQPYLAEGKFNAEGEWDYANPKDKDAGYLLKEDPRSYFFDPNGLSFEPDLWNDGGVQEYWRGADGKVIYEDGIPAVKSRFGIKQTSLNCGAYAFNMQFDPLTGKDLFSRNSDDGFGYQPGQFARNKPNPWTKSERAIVYNCQEDGDSVLLDLAQADMKVLGLKLVPESIASATQRQAGYKIAYIVKPQSAGGDYHWLRIDANGTWSHKAGTLRATQGAYSDGATMIDPLAQSGEYTHGVGDGTIPGCNGYFYVVPINVN